MYQHFATKDMENKEAKLSPEELKELKRKISAINSLIISANALEKDKQDFLAEILKGKGIDGSKKMNLDLDTGEITLAEDKE